MKRPSGHPGTSRAGPPRCLVRWQCDSPRSLITFRRSADRDLGRNSAVYPAVSQPFLRRFSTEMGKKLGFEGQKRLKDHRQRHNRWLQHHPRLDMARRWGPIAAFLNDNKYNYSSSQCAFFKIVCGILEFLDRATRNCRPHGTCLQLGSLEPLYQNVSIDVR
jgi:hypothetical protein